MSTPTKTRKDLLERLADGPVVGDGSFVMTLEMRGYVSAGTWTPEAVLEYPDAVRQLHREFLRAGSDVMQTFTFNGSEDKEKVHSDAQINFDWRELNRKACDLAREVADEGDALVAGCLSAVPAFKEGKGKQVVQDEFRKQCAIFVEKKVDFLLGEFFGFVEEAEWAIEVMASTGLPVGCTMRISSIGDESGVSPGEVAVRMARAGASMVGINCYYDYDTSLNTISLMKDALAQANLKTYLILQPVGYHAQEVCNNPKGYFDLPEFPFAMETRLLSRVDCHKFARRAFELGVHYIGGCCGFQPYHIRAIAEELSVERKKRPLGQDKYEGYAGLLRSIYPEQRRRGNATYWNEVVPAMGRERGLKLAEIKGN